MLHTAVFLQPLIFLSFVGVLLISCGFLKLQCDDISQSPSFIQFDPGTFDQNLSGNKVDYITLLVIKLYLLQFFQKYIFKIKANKYDKK